MSNHMVQLFVSTNDSFNESILVFQFIVGRNQSNRANFIRIPSNASPSYVKQFLVQKCENKVKDIIYHWEYEFIFILASIVGNICHWECTRI